MSGESDSELCGAPKGNGDPCDNPVKYADGKCGIHTGVTDTEQGRPTKFTDERARAAIAAAKEGKSKRGCDRAAKVARGTVDNWLDQTHTFENASGKLDSFFDAFADARAEGEGRYIADGRSEAGDTSFAKFMLSSSYGYTTEEKRQHEHSGEMDVGVSGVIDAMREGREKAKREDETGNE